MLHKKLDSSQKEDLVQMQYKLANSSKFQKISYEEHDYRKLYSGL